MSVTIIQGDVRAELPRCSAAFARGWLWSHSRNIAHFLGNTKYMDMARDRIVNDAPLFVEVVR